MTTRKAYRQERRFAYQEMIAKQHQHILDLETRCDQWIDEGYSPSAIKLVEGMIENAYRIKRILRLASNSQ